MSPELGPTLRVPKCTLYANGHMTYIQQTEQSGQVGTVGKVVEIDCEKSMKLETSPKVTSKRSLHWCRSISKTLSVQVLLQYQSKSYYIIGQEVYYSIGRFYYIFWHLLHYRAFFITLSGTYYSIGRLLHYRLVQGWSSTGGTIL